MKQTQRERFLFHSTLKMLRCYSLLQKRLSSECKSTTHAKTLSTRLTDSKNRVLSKIKFNSSKSPLTSSQTPFRRQYKVKSEYCFRSIHSNALFSRIEDQETQISFRNIFGAVTGVIGAFFGYQQANAEDNNTGEVKLALPADPWLLTAEKPKEEEKKRLSPFQRLLRFLWHVIRIVSGIEVASILLRMVSRLLYELKQGTLDKMMQKIVCTFFEMSPLRRPIDPYSLASELSEIISHFSGTSVSYIGVIQALDKELLLKLPISISHLCKERYRPTDHPNWTIPYVSTTTYEEAALSPQFTSFLAESKRDAGIYLVQSYFGVIAPEMNAIPLVVYYSKVATSLSAFERGEVLETFNTRLNTSAPIGDLSDACKDMSTEYRAMFMPSDINGAIMESDWIRYIGCPQSKASLKREKSNTPEWDKWSLLGPTGTIRSQIMFEPRSIATPIEIFFPETSDTIESRAMLPPSSVICSRWCKYAEVHPTLGAILGEQVKLVSSPMVQESVSSGSDFDGTVFDTWFTCAGSKGSLRLHFKSVSDQSQDGRHPTLPVLGVWVEPDPTTSNPSKVPIEIYSNPRRRYQMMQQTPVSIPLEEWRPDLPLMLSNIHIVEEKR